MHASRLIRWVLFASPLFSLVAANAQTPCFSSCRQVSVGMPDQQEAGGSLAAARADLDGDGRDDLAVTSSPQRVEIFWNSALGLAQTTQVLSIPVLAAGLDAADLDGDGDLDLIITAFGSFSPSLFFLRNLGGRQFGAPVTLEQLGVRQAQFGDLDGDGDLDIVCAYSGSAYGKCFWNAGGGTFSTTALINFGVSTSAIALGDLDGDGLPELVLAPYVGPPTAPLPISVLKNLGGTFAAPTTWAAGMWPINLELGDLDRDGDLDVIVFDRNSYSTTSTTPGLVHTLLNDGAGHLAESSALNTDAAPNFAELGDFDGDHLPELAILCMTGHRLHLARNLGAGVFAQPVVTPASEDVRVLSAIDVDADGRLDLAMCSLYDNDVVFLHNEGAAGLRAGEGFPSSPSPSFLTFADVDGDGIDEAITLDRDAQTFSVQQVVAGVPAAPVSYPLGPMPNVTRPSDAALADLDADGDLDVVVAEQTDIAIFVNQGNGTFAPRIVQPTIGNPTAVATGDFDQDGDIDIAFNQESPHKMVLMQNAGNGVFAMGPSIVAGYNLGSLCAGDFDGDGWTDIAVVAESGGGSFRIALNRGGGQFQLTPFLLTCEIPRRVRSADLDGDGDLDLVFASAWWQGISVALNHGDGTFDTPVGYEIDPIVNDVALLDADRDGDLDIVFQYLNRLEIMTNGGQGQFTRDQFLGTHTSAVSIAITDIDRDGDVDIAWVDGRTSEIRLQRGCANDPHVLCTGDGSGAACPCGNASPVSSGAGCLNSLGVGGTLRANGSATLWNDRVVLLGAGMPNSTALYMSGTTAVGGGTGVVFGDGLRCVNGTVLRLGTRANVLGQSRYPNPGDLSLSARGGVTTPGVRYYQAWYRNAGAYCTSSTFNLTNGLAIVWSL